MKKLFSKLRNIRWRRLGFGLIAVFVALLCFERFLSSCFPYPMHRLDRYGESRRIFDSDNTLLRLTTTFNEERLIKVPLDQISSHLLNAVIAGEDSRFYTHSGVDPIALVRALVTSVWKGKIISGASTLSMQVSRLAEPKPRTLVWKVVEMFRARQLERILSKQEILQRYLNLVPLGGTLRGVEAASQRWFGKPASQLTALESAMFVAMLPAPTRRSPIKTGSELLHWRNEILRRMNDDDFINDEMFERFKKEPLHATFRQWNYLAPHFSDWKLKTSNKAVVYSTLELPIQKIVESILVNRRDKPVDGAAVVVLDRHSGFVVAMAGSENYREKPFNVALAHRPAGSTLKPFLYALALEKGVVGIDGNLSDHPANFGSYRPKNFSGDFMGNIRAADALSDSRNLPAVKLLKSIGIKEFSKLLRNLGFNVPYDNIGLDLSLGTLVVSPLELAQAYRRFFDPKNDMVSQASKDAVLKALSKHSPNSEQLPDNAIAWKTGTSSGRRDAWCVGISKDRIVVVWLGNLNGKGHSDLVGSKLAREIMVSIMSRFTS